MGRIVIIALSVVAICAISGIVLFMLFDDDGSSNDESSNPDVIEDYDYTILDSIKNVKQGDKILIRGIGDNVTGVMELTAVSIGKYTMTVDERSVYDCKNASRVSSYFFDGNISFDDFDKDGVLFDIESKPPEGVNVTKKGNEYLIDGSFTRTRDGLITTYVYDSLSIMSDPKFISYNPISVNGDMSIQTYADSDHDSTVYGNYSFKTIGSSLKVTMEETTKIKTVWFSDMWYDYMYASYPGERSGITVDKSTARIGNVIADVYTLNGTTEGDSGIHVYQNYKYYVYKGFGIKEDGVKDGIGRTSYMYYFRDLS